MYFELTLKLQKKLIYFLKFIHDTQFQVFFLPFKFNFFKKLIIIFNTY